MAFSPSVVAEMIAAAPSGAFNNAGTEKIQDWVNFVLQVDSNPADKHDLFYYLSVARLLAETGGSVTPSDFEDPHMRDMIKAGIVANSTPYAGEQDEKWRTWKVVPA